MLKDIDKESVEFLGFFLDKKFRLSGLTAVTKNNFDEVDLIFSAGSKVVEVESKLDVNTKWDFSNIELDFEELENRRYGNFFQTHAKYNQKIKCSEKDKLDRVLIIDIRKFKVLKEKKAWLAYIFTDGILLLNTFNANVYECEYSCKKSQNFSNSEMKFLEKYVLDVNNSEYRFYKLPLKVLIPIHLDYYFNLCKSIDLEFLKKVYREEIDIVEDWFNKKNTYK